jgi:xanthine dehydrogenase accessory factor
MKEIFQTMALSLESEPAVALVTVIRSTGSTPRHAAAKMMVRADGSFVGTIGGGTMEKKAIQDAQAALATGQPCLRQYHLTGKTPQSMGLCGGTQEVFIDIMTSSSKNEDPQDIIDFCKNIVDACDAGEPIALITVVRSHQGVAWQEGAKILLHYDKSMFGRLGKIELEPKLLAAAQDALQQNRSIRLGYHSEDENFTELNGTSREAVEFFVDIIQPRTELLIIGAGHIGLALAELARVLGWRVIVVDDRPEWSQRFPEADETIIIAYNAKTETLDTLPVTITPSTYILVATWGWDEPALAQVASSVAPYIGLVASRRKAKIIFDDLLERGVPEQDLARVRVPAGLHLGAETPPEIALSIMAEILLLERGATARPLAEIKGHPLSLSTARSWR